MYNYWRTDLNDSIKALESIKDTILPYLISGEIYSIEKSQNEILILMDTLSGIDYIRKNKNGLQGIAARVQWANKPYNTFTIRSGRSSGVDTELKKRLFQINNGYFYPAFTLQAYFDNRIDNKLLSIGIIRTKDLYNLYLNEPSKFKKNKSDNDFIFISWDSIDSKLIKTKIRKAICH